MKLQPYEGDGGPLGVANERTYDGQLGPYEWWLPDLAKAIAMSALKLADWRVVAGSGHARLPPKDCGSCGPTERNSNA